MGVIKNFALNIIGMFSVFCFISEIVVQLWNVLIYLFLPIMKKLKLKIKTIMALHNYTVFFVMPYVVMLIEVLTNEEWCDKT